MLQKNEKQDVAPVPIWRCKDRECKAWVRAELSSDREPTCPICNGAMMKSMKHLPKLVKKFKKPKTEQKETVLH